jgi:hypothetical protein
MIDWEALNGDDPAAEIARVCAIDVTDMETVMQAHPALFGYASASYEVARAQQSTAEWSLDRTKAAVFEEKKAEDPKASVSGIKEVLENDPKVIAASNEVLQSTRRALLLKSLVNALDHRRDMIIQISARHREEMRSQL